MTKNDVIIYLRSNGFSMEQINEIVNALEGEAYRAGVKYVVNKLRDGFIMCLRIGKR